MKNFFNSNRWNRFVKVFVLVLILNVVLGFLLGGLLSLLNPMRWMIVIGLGVVAGYLSTRNWHSE